MTENRILIKTSQIILILAAVILTATCNEAETIKRCPIQDDCHGFLMPEHEDIYRTMASDIARFQMLVEKAFTYRAETLKVYKKLKKEFQQDIPLSGADMEILNTGILAHLKLRQQLYETAYAYECWLDKKCPVKDEQLRLQGIMLSLAAALMLYDNYLLAISVFEDDKKLRRYINKRNKGYKITHSRLTDVTKQYNSINKRHRIRRGIKYFDSNWGKQLKSFKHTDENSYLYLLIKQSPSYNSTLKKSPLFVINRYGKFMSGITSDTMKKIKDDGINLFSLIFGNSVGLIQTRKGLLYDKTDVQTEVSDTLKACDILLEKTPFRLTDKFIPGYWGHVAIWIGTEKEIKDLGIWDHPVVKKYHNSIREQKSIAEALRPGVTLSSVPHFLNIDDLAVLRCKKLTNKKKADIIIRTLRQIGKPYDFNFDVETNDRIVCSELIYVTFTDFDWPTQSTLGRHTVSPTHIAEKTYVDGRFDVVSLYLEGKPVNKKKNKIFAKLN